MPVPSLLFLIAAGVLLLYVALWLFCIKPRSPLDAPDMEKLRRYDYAHRGFYAKDQSVPENSLPAFQRAVSKKFGVELDLQLTADGQVVVFHDDTLKRMCGVDVLLSSLTYEQLQAYTLAGTGEKIPLLTQVLKVMQGKTPMIVEFKPYHNTDELCEKAYDILKLYKGDWCMESFSPAAVRWFRKHHPEIIRGQLMAHFTHKDASLNVVTAFLGRNLFTNVLTRPDFVAYDVNSRNNWSLRTACRLFHMQEVSWTIRTPQLLWSIKADGAMGIFEHFDPSKEKSPDNSII